MCLLRALLSIFVCLIGLTGTGSVLAHPLTTRNVRVIHLDAVGSDVVAYIRLTLPLLVGNGVAQPSADMRCLSLHSLFRGGRARCLSGTPI